MMKILPLLAPDTVGISATGLVSAADYETVFVPAVEEALSHREKVKILYQLESDFTGFAAGAMWDDMKLGMAHLAAWEKIAMVTDVEWIAHAMGLFSFAVPCPVRVFALKDQLAARAWLAT